MALTKQDKKDIQQLLLENNKNLVTKNDLEEKNRHLGYIIDEKFDDFRVEMTEKMIEFRNDIMNHIDSFAGEIKTTHEERETQSEQILRNTKRIEKLEKKVFSSSTS